jgi:hypothetical protein
LRVFTTTRGLMTFGGVHISPHSLPRDGVRNHTQLQRAGYFGRVLRVIYLAALRGLPGVICVWKLDRSFISVGNVLYSNPKPP